MSVRCFRLWLWSIRFLVLIILRARALERFHWITKSKLHTYCLVHGPERGEDISLLLFTICETVQKSLKLLQEQLVADSPPNVNVLDYVSSFKRAHDARGLAKQAVVNSESKLKEHFDKNAALHSLVLYWLYEGKYYHQAWLPSSVKDCTDSVGSACYVTKLDLLKGYWQVPLTESFWHLHFCYTK